MDDYDDNSINEEDNNENIQTPSIGSIPLNAKVNGLITGNIPECLKDLNYIEINMISIYCPISRVRIQGNNIFYI